MDAKLDVPLALAVDTIVVQTMGGQPLDAETIQAIVQACSSNHHGELNIIVQSGCDDDPTVAGLPGISTTDRNLSQPTNSDADLVKVDMVTDKIHIYGGGDVVSRVASHTETKLSSTDIINNECDMDQQDRLKVTDPDNDATATINIKDEPQQNFGGGDGKLNSLHCSQSGDVLRQRMVHTGANMDVMGDEAYHLAGGDVPSKRARLSPEYYVKFSGKSVMHSEPNMCRSNIIMEPFAETKHAADKGLTHKGTMDINKHEADDKLGLTIKCYSTGNENGTQVDGYKKKVTEAIEVNKINEDALLSTEYMKNEIITCSNNVDKNSDSSCDDDKCIAGDAGTSKTEVVKHTKLTTQCYPVKCSKCDKEFAGRRGMARVRVHEQTCDGAEELIEDGTGDLNDNMDEGEADCDMGDPDQSHSESNNTDDWTNLKGSQSNNNKFTCDMCGKTFQRKFNLDRHLNAMNVHSNMKQHVPKPAACDVCGKILHSVSALCVHKRIHTGAMFMCNICGRGFTQRSNMKMHMRTVHEGVKDIVCKVCEEKFSTTTNLAYHNKKVHMYDEMAGRYTKLDYVQSSECIPKTGDNTMYCEKSKMVVTGVTLFDCPVCPRAFTKVYSWFAHLIQHLKDSDVTPDQEQQVRAVITDIQGTDGVFDDLALYPCSHCDHISYSRCDQQTHRDRHYTGRPYACQYCDIKFVSKTECSMHEQHHTKIFRYRCDKCTEGFSVLRNLKLHLVNKHGVADDEVPGKKLHRCDVCRAVFPFKSLLDTHKNTTHKGQKNFKCDICDKGFGTKYGVQVHRRTHTNRRPYDCPKCNKSFADPSNLIHHGKRMHKDTPQSVFKQRHPILDDETGLKRYKSSLVQIHGNVDHPRDSVDDHKRNMSFQKTASQAQDEG